jgi:hypothetical protein
MSGQDFIKTFNVANKSQKQIRWLLLVLTFNPLFLIFNSLIREFLLLYE